MSGLSLIRYALLSLLSREPLSGYDIKLQMNRFSPFWKAGSNQIYPELAKMEKEGLIQLQRVEQHTHRPARKIYEITTAGQDSLIEWTIAPGELDRIRDDFLIKVYNSWLIEPDKMIGRITDVKQQHEERLHEYEDKLVELREMVQGMDDKAPLISSISVIEFGVEYEQLYIKWCEKLMSQLEPTK